jgi:hypothetical protein
MVDVERLTLASQVQVKIIDPRSVDARYCLRSYFGLDPVLWTPNERAKWCPSRRIRTHFHRMGSGPPSCLVRGTANDHEGNWTW